MKKCLTLTMVVLSCVASLFAATGDDGMSVTRNAIEGKPEAAAPKQAVALRDTKITAEKMEYNAKEAVAIMTENVVVDDARFYLTSDKLFVFMDSTNSLSQLVVLGNVTVKDELNRHASCDRAVYTKSEARLVMVGNAKMTSYDEAGKARTITGDKITIWTDDQRMEVYPRPTLFLPADATDNGMKGLMK